MNLLPKAIHVVCLMSGECVVVSRSSQNVNNCTHTMGCNGKHVFTPSPISNVPIWSWFQLFLLWHTQKMLLSASKVNIATDIDINFQHSCQLKPENRFVNMKRTSRPNSWSSAERWANSCGNPFHCLTPICHLGEIVPRCETGLVCLGRGSLSFNSDCIWPDMRHGPRATYISCTHLVHKDCNSRRRRNLGAARDVQDPLGLKQSIFIATPIVLVGEYKWNIIFYSKHWISSFQLLVLIVGCCLIRHVAKSEGKAKPVVNF